MIDDIETLRGFITQEHGGTSFLENEALAALERIVVARDSLRKALDDRHADDLKAWKAIMRATGKERGIPPNKEVVAWHVAEMERLEKELDTALRDAHIADLCTASAETERDSLRAKLDRAKEALGPFANESHFYDQSEQEGRIVDDEIRAADTSLTVGHFRRAHALLSELSVDAPAQQTQISDKVEK